MIWHVGLQSALSCKTAYVWSFPNPIYLTTTDTNTNIMNTNTHTHTNICMSSVVMFQLQNFLFLVFSNPSHLKYLTLGHNIGEEKNLKGESVSVTVVDRELNVESFVCAYV